MPGCLITRDHFVLPNLARAAAVSKDASGARQEVAKALVTAYSFLPGCNELGICRFVVSDRLIFLLRIFLNICFSGTVVCSSVLPGLAALLELVQEVHPDLEASVLQVISKVEVKSRGEASREKRWEGSKERRKPDGEF